MSVLEPEDVGAVRRAVNVAAVTHGIVSGVPELIATELASNLLRHADGGEILFRALKSGMEILAIDRGPGLSHDHVSGLLRNDEPPSSAHHSPNSPGLGVGLSSVRRLSSTFDIYSRPGRGTVVLSRIQTPELGSSSRIAIGGIGVPIQGELESGDAWSYIEADTFGVAVVDGLGHGPDAADAADAAIAALEAGYLSDVTSCMLTVHKALRATRGAVLSICVIDTVVGAVVYTGIGNVSGRIVSDGNSVSMVTRDGVAGIGWEPPESMVMRYVWKSGSMLILFSDGLRSSWDPREYIDLQSHDPTLTAAVIFRDTLRNTDDATIVVVVDRTAH